VNCSIMQSKLGEVQSKISLFKAIESNFREKMLGLFERNTNIVFCNHPKDKYVCALYTVQQYIEDSVHVGQVRPPKDKSTVARFRTKRTSS
jgi:hypothetical protein